MHAAHLMLDKCGIATLLLHASCMLHRNAPHRLSNVFAPKQFNKSSTLAAKLLHN